MSIFTATLNIITPTSMALAEVSDKIEETRANHWIVTCGLILLTAVAAASGWRRALILWPVTLLWGLIAFGTVWEWRDKIQQEGTLTLLWKGGATLAAMVLAPPLLAGLARRWRRGR